MGEQEEPEPRFSAVTRVFLVFLAFGLFGAGVLAHLFLEPSIRTGVLFTVLASYTFLGVAILCDEYLCPALDGLCDYLQIPTSLAAVTFVSFGSSAPELIISGLGAQTDKTELSIPAVLVSALIAFGAIPPLVVFAAGELTLHVRSV